MRSWRWGSALFVVLAMGLGMADPVSATKLYKWKDAQGRTHYSQTPPPDQSIDYDTARMDGDVRDELKPYCAAMNRFATEVYFALQRGVPLNAVLSTSRSAERQYLEGTSNQGQLQEVANYVRNLRHGKVTAAEAAKLVEDSCLRGTYGDGGMAKGAAKAAAPSARSGTGWFAAPGLVVTSLHVVEGKNALSVVTSSGDTLSASLVRSDAQRDLALLRVSGAHEATALPVAAAEARIGANVFTIGFPHTGVMGIKPKLTTGVISARSGIRDDPDSYQISVPVQAGNSGGPLLDEQGHVVGIVTAKLSAGAMYQSTRDMTQNVNYAVKVGFVSGWLDTHAAARVPEGSREDVAEWAERAVVRVLAE